MECRGDKHSDPHVAGVFNFQTALWLYEGWVKDRAYLADPSFQDPSRIRTQPDIRIFSLVYLLQIVLVYITNNPNQREIGDSQRIWRSECLNRSGGR